MTNQPVEPSQINQVIANHLNAIASSMEERAARLHQYAAAILADTSLVPQLGDQHAGPPYANQIITEAEGYVKPINLWDLRHHVTFALAKCQRGDA